MKKILLLIALFITIAFADLGVIPYDPDIAVYEPSQKAIIGFDGQREILILSTNVYASAPGTALEIIPLPAEPTISEGDFDSFYAVKDLLMEAKYVERGFPIPTGGDAAVNVIFREQIGAHDITVVHATDLAEFRVWLRGFLAGQTASAEQKLAAVLPHYFDQKINYFVFDNIELESVEKSRQPIIYEFDSSSLYYPLVISTLAGGDTRIQIFTITSDLLNMTDFAAADFEKTAEVQIDSVELGWIDEKLLQMFPNSAFLTGAVYEGPNNFTKDIGGLFAAAEPEPDMRLLGLIAGIIVAVFVLGFIAILIKSIKGLK